MAIISLSEAAKRLPAGRPVDRSTWHRWSRIGLGPRKIRLPLVRCGKQLGVDELDLAAWLNALKDPVDIPAPRSTKRSTSGRRPVSEELVKGELARCRAACSTD